MNKIVLITTALFFGSLTLKAQQSSCQQLISASKSNSISIVKTLLKKVNPNCKDISGEPRTALVAASRKGHLDVVKLLVNAKANINFYVKGDETPLMAASAYGHKELVSYFIKKGSKVNINLDSDGTALISAVRNNHYQIAKILLENGANPAITTDGDEYAMYHAKKNSNRKMIVLLNQYKNKNKRN
jgi:ankyrin repeat protein